MILTTTNKKGGTGKTTLNILLAEFLYQHGQKVLIIGLDPNCSISEVYGKVLLTGREVQPYLLKEHTRGGTLSIIPEDLDLSMLSNVMDTKLKHEIKKQDFAENTTISLSTRREHGMHRHATPFLQLTQSL